jgi:two-component system CitB family sensor kinase
MRWRTLAWRAHVGRRLIQSLAEQVRSETTASYIVVIDRQGVRYSHTNPTHIGQRVTEPVVALDGRDHLGNLGVSANARTPLRAMRTPGGVEVPA